MNGRALVTAPARLHFGLLRFRQRHGPSYGGLGMAIDAPRTVVEASWGRAWSFVGPQRACAEAAARQALAAFAPATGPHAPLAVRVLEVAERHQGLGSGTQLALAVAAGVRALCGLPHGSPQELAFAVGRGLRSAVGTYGFVHGGLIWERGRTEGESLGRLAARTALPQAWRVVLVHPRGQTGLSGVHERRAFEIAPPVEEATVRRLERLAESHILRAAQRADFDAFSEGVFEYGRMAGECFAAIQGGVYASAELAERVALIRAEGVRGVGQSSWGPTLFALVCDALEADALVDRLGALSRFGGCRFRIVGADNCGATIDVSNAPQSSL